jgi:DhnA family fructose-bisphosphate aldolase class Ia
MQPSTHRRRTTRPFERGQGQLFAAASDQGRTEDATPEEIELLHEVCVMIWNRRAAEEVRASACTGWVEMSIGIGIGG